MHTLSLRLLSSFAALLIIELASSNLPAAETISGRVYIDANGNGQLDGGETGLAGVAVTDGVQIVESGADGSYRLELADDPVLPIRNTRTVAISWPTNTWPSGAWYRRLDQTKPGDAINFGLVQEKQKFPFAVVHATDPHDAFRRDFNYLWRQDVGRMGDLVRFAVVTGDLGYMGPDNADKDFADIRQFTRDFPVPMFHTPGNHDIVGIHSTDWKKPTDIHGNGAYTKYLGPLRWSFTYAGVHFIGLDWARVEPNGSLQTGHPDVAVHWLDADLKRLPAGARIIGFSHQFWSPDPKFWQLVKKYKFELLMAGHAHRNMDISNDGIEYQLTMSLSKILHVKAQGHQLVDYCQGYNLAKPGTHVGHCRLFVLEQFQPRRGEHEGLIDKRLTGASYRFKPMPTKACELELTIEPETARKFGVRIATGDAAASRLEVAIEGNTISAGDLTTAAGRRHDDNNIHLHLLWDNELLEVRCNRRSFFTQPLKAAGPLSIELFAEGGPAVFRQVDLWELRPGTSEQLMEIAGYYSTEGGS
ncbi:MAG: metallophosphoesterase [Planctomycetes bacterium]|nr:metallophosphoesterase [Planctomycetota bacterium]